MCVRVYVCVGEWAAVLKYQEAKGKRCAAAAAAAAAAATTAAVAAAAAAALGFLSFPFPRLCFFIRGIFSTACGRGTNS